MAPVETPILSAISRMLVPWNPCVVNSLRAASMIRRWFCSIRPLAILGTTGPCSSYEADRRLYATTPATSLGVRIQTGLLRSFFECPDLRNPRHDDHGGFVPSDGLHLAANPIELLRSCNAGFNNRWRGFAQR